MNLRLIKQKAEIDKFIVIVGDFYTLLLIDYTKINEDIDDMNNTINQFDVTDICRTLYLRPIEYTFFQLI